MVNVADIDTVRALIADVRDPEIPILTIADLGILRDVYVSDGVICVEITPTYVGCPAMDTIRQDIESVLAANGCEEVVIKTTLAPAWTTEWLSEEAKDKLRSVGIAPPEQASASKRSLFADEPAVPCPRCNSTATERISEFGSTACKALYRCTDCLEPFDYFKCL